MMNRRHFIQTAAVSAGAMLVLPSLARAAAHGGMTFETGNGELTISPISHASFVMQTPGGVLYVDPVGDAAAYEGQPAPEAVLITHQHGDHYSPETLAAVAGDAPLVVNPAVHDMLPEDLKARSTAIANGESGEALGIGIDAVPAYNVTEERLNFHPKGRDNGYVLNVGDFRVYVSGDTEAHEEMRALEDIDLAFVCMNLPFTMAAEQAADGVAAFKPKVVIPYHFRGRDGGTQDPEEFARLVAEKAADVEVRQGDWYPGGL